MIKSIYDNQFNILTSIIILHTPQGFHSDITYGNGAFYKNIPPELSPKLKFDIQPLFPDVVKSDSTNLPILSNSLNNIVFDPPFLTYIKKGRDHTDKNGKKSIMSSRFGGYYSYQELISHYDLTLKEIARTLKYKGILIFKCQDIIHNHKMHPTHVNTINLAQTYNLQLKDMFILHANHRMPSPQKGQQQHARIFHSYFLIFKNNNKK